MSRLLSQKEIEKDLQASFGETALMIACEKGNKSILKALIEAKCDPTISDAHERNAYEYVNFTELDGEDDGFLSLI